MDGNRIAREMCDKAPFTQYNDWVKYGCIKLVTDHREAVLMPWNGKREYGDHSKLVELKYKARTGAVGPRAWRPPVVTLKQSYRVLIDCPGCSFSSSLCCYSWSQRS